MAGLVIPLPSKLRNSTETASQLFSEDSWFPSPPHVRCGGRYWGRGWDELDCAHAAICPSSPARAVPAGAGQASPYLVLVARTGTRCVIRQRLFNCFKRYVGRNCSLP